jgi:hypothetical protein
VLAELKLHKPRPKPRVIVSRSLHKIDEESFMADLYSYPWDSILNCCDVNLMVDNFNSFMMNLFEVHAPLLHRKMRIEVKPWITDNLKKMTSLRDKAMVRAKTTKNVAHIEYYKSLKNLVNSTLKREKSGFFNYYVNNNNKNLNLMWKSIKKVTTLSDPSQSKLPEELRKPNEINN